MLNLFSLLILSGDTNKLDVSRNQISLFNDISKTIEDNLNNKMVRHILNSDGFMNFQSPDEYGKIRDFFIWRHKNTNLQQINKLKSVISQNRNIKKGESVGYSSGFIATKTMNISVVPVGYVMAKQKIRK